MTTGVHHHTLEDLDRLDARIESRIREFREQGEFSNIDDAYLNELDEKRSNARQRLDTAVQRGNIVAILGAEVRRELLAILDDVTRLIERLEATSMKRPD